MGDHADEIAILTFWVIDLKALDDAETQATLYIQSTYEGKRIHQWLAELGAEPVRHE